MVGNGEVVPPTGEIGLRGGDMIGDHGNGAADELNDDDAVNDGE